MKISTATLYLMLAATLFGGCSINATDAGRSNGGDTMVMPDPGEANGLLDVARAAGSFQYLLTAVEAAGLTETLSGDTEFTIFAPTDLAFEALESAYPGLLANVLADTDALQDLLFHHVVPGRLNAAAVTSAVLLTTLDERTVAIDQEAGRVMIRDAQLIQTDIEARNGIIHVIDTVMIPEEAPVEPVEPMETNTIIDIARDAGQFGTLLAAVDAAGLTETLSGDTPFTVFAPTDAAFAALEAANPGIIETLLGNPDALREVLLYHVVSGEVFAADVVTLEQATTVEGRDIAISNEDGDIRIGGAGLLQTDIEASNGVIHVIDTVLDPGSAPEPQPGNGNGMGNGNGNGNGNGMGGGGTEPVASNTIVDVARRAGGFQTLLAAVEAAGLTEVLSGSDEFTVLAPTDAAFEALEAANPGIIATLINDPETLRSILLYHVVAGRAPASVVSGLDRAETVEGRLVEIEMRGNALYVGGARVLLTDVEADNGIIHVIDAVLLPPEEDIDELELLRGIEENEGAFGSGGKDIYSFSIDADGHIAASLGRDGNCNADAMIEIFAMNGDEFIAIARSDDDAESCAFVESLLTPGDYALVVSGRDGAPVEQYTMGTALVATIDQDGEVQGGFSQNGDDVYRIEIEQNSVVRFEVSDGENGCAGDTVSTLYQVNADGSTHRVGFDNNGGRGQCSVIQGLLHTGTYLLVVGGNNGVAVEDYELAVSIN